MHLATIHEILLKYVIPERLSNASSEIFYYNQLLHRGSNARGTIAVLRPLLPLCSNRLWL